MKTKELEESVNEIDCPNFVNYRKLNELIDKEVTDPLLAEFKRKLTLRLEEFKRNIRFQTRSLHNKCSNNKEKGK